MGTPIIFIAGLRSPVWSLLARASAHAHVRAHTHTHTVTAGPSEIERETPTIKKEAQAGVTGYGRCHGEGRTLEREGTGENG